MRFCALATPRNHARREPLFTLTEISDRVGIPARSLRAYLSSLRKSAPAVLATTSCTHGTGRVTLYRMSEFKSWMDVNNIAAKYAAHCMQSSHDSAR